MVTGTVTEGEATPPEPRVSTGNANLDVILNGGFVARRPYLIVGPAGTGKTKLALGFLCEGVRRGEHVLLVTLEDPPNELKINHRALSPLLDRVYVFDAIPDVMRYERAPFKDIAAVRHSVPFSEVPYEIRKTPDLTSVEVTFSALEQTLKMEINRRNYTRLVIDSLTALQYFCMKGVDEVVGAQTFLRFLSDLGVTTVLTVESPVEETETAERLLARGEVRLFRWELDERTVRAIGVEKFRGSAHDIRLHPYRISSTGLDIDLNTTISRDTRRVQPPSIDVARGKVPDIPSVASADVGALLVAIRDLGALGIDVSAAEAEIDGARAATRDNMTEAVVQHLFRARTLVSQLALEWRQSAAREGGAFTAEVDERIQRIAVEVGGLSDRSTERPVPDPPATERPAEGPRTPPASSAGAAPAPPGPPTAALAPPVAPAQATGSPGTPLPHRPFMLPPVSTRKANTQPPLPAARVPVAEPPAAPEPTRAPSPVSAEPERPEADRETFAIPPALPTQRPSPPPSAPAPSLPSAPAEEASRHRAAEPLEPSGPRVADFVPEPGSDGPMELSTTAPPEASAGPAAPPVAVPPPAHEPARRPGGRSRAKPATEETAGAAKPKRRAPRRRKAPPVSSAAQGTPPPETASGAGSAPAALETSPGGTPVSAGAGPTGEATPNPVAADEPERTSPSPPTAPPAETAGPIDPAAAPAPAGIARSSPAPEPSASTTPEAAPGPPLPSTPVGPPVAEPVAAPPPVESAAPIATAEAPTSAAEGAAAAGTSATDPGPAPPPTAPSKADAVRPSVEQAEAAEQQPPPEGGA